MDAASVGQRDDPELRGKLVIVAWKGNDSVVCAASYEAGAYGCVQPCRPREQAVAFVLMSLAIKMFPGKTPKTTQSQRGRVAREHFERIS